MSERQSKKNWSETEDEILTKVVSQNTGPLKWSKIAKSFDFLAQGSYVRTTKQCRQRWLNRLDPHLNNSNVWPQEEIQDLYRLYQIHGHKWTKIAEELVAMGYKLRGDNNIKNFFYSNAKRAIKSLNLFVHVFNSKVRKEMKDPSKGTNASQQVKMQPEIVLQKQNQNKLLNFSELGSLSVLESFEEAKSGEKKPSDDHSLILENLAKDSRKRLLRPIKQDILSKLFLLTQSNKLNKLEIIETIESQNIELVRKQFIDVLITNQSDKTDENLTEVIEGLASIARKCKKKIQLKKQTFALGKVKQKYLQKRKLKQDEEAIMAKTLKSQLKVTNGIIPSRKEKSIIYQTLRQNQPIETNPQDDNAPKPTNRTKRIGPIKRKIIKTPNLNNQDEKEEKYVPPKTKVGKRMKQGEKPKSQKKSKQQEILYNSRPFQNFEVDNYVLRKSTDYFPKEHPMSSIMPPFCPFQTSQLLCDRENSQYNSSNQLPLMNSTQILRGCIDGKDLSQHLFSSNPQFQSLNPSTQYGPEPGNLKQETGGNLTSFFLKNLPEKNQSPNQPASYHPFPLDVPPQLNSNVPRHLNTNIEVGRQLNANIDVNKKSNQLQKGSFNFSSKQFSNFQGSQNKFNEVQKLLLGDNEEENNIGKHGNFRRFPGFNDGQSEGSVQSRSRQNSVNREHFENTFLYRSQKMEFPSDEELNRSMSYPFFEQMFNQDVNKTDQEL